MFETITVNLSGKVRRATLNGKSYLVAPMTLIVPGVLNGSKGRLYYPPEEVSKNPSIWNNIPLTLGHPTHPTSNEHQSAKDDGVLERVGLGFTKNGRWDGSRLQGDAWFEEDRVRQLAPAIHNKLQAEEAFELSTGLYTENEEKAGNHNGKPYDFIARNYRSDHVAVLLNELGACSVRDGCGVIVNALKTSTKISKQTHDSMVETVTALNASIEQAVKAGFSDTDSPYENDDEDELDIEEGADDGRGKVELIEVDDVTGNAFSPQARAAAAASRRAHGASQRTDLGKVSKHIVSAATGLIGSKKQPYTHADVAKSHEYAASQHRSAAQLGGGGKSQHEEAAKEHDKAAAAHMSAHIERRSPTGNEETKVDNEFDSPHYASKQACSASMESDGPRKHAIKALDASGAGNSREAADHHVAAAEAHEKAATDARKDKEPDDAASHDRMASMHRSAASMHTAKHALSRNSETTNTETAVDRNQMLTKLTANCSCEKDKAALNGLSDETLKVLYNSQPPEPAKKPDVAITVNSNTTQPEKPMAERMTPEELQVWNYGRMSMEAHKQQLVSRLTANIADKDQKARMATNLMAKGIPELNDLAMLLPAAPQQEMHHIRNGSTDLPPIFLGAGGGADHSPTVNRAVESVDLPAEQQWPPTLNYEEMSGFKDGKLVRMGS